jgi:hypothetical protein
MMALCLKEGKALISIYFMDFNKRALKQILPATIAFHKSFVSIELYFRPPVNEGNGW